MIIEFAEKMIDAIQAEMESKSKQRKDSINQHELPALALPISKCSNHIWANMK